MRSQCEKLHLIKRKKPNPNGVISISITSIDACERSERALGEIALSRLQLDRARLMMKGKGDTSQERNGACAKVQRGIIKKRHSPGMKKVSHENRKWAIVDGKGAMTRYEKGAHM